MEALTTLYQARLLKELGFNGKTESNYIRSTGELVSSYDYQRNKEYQTVVNWVKCPTVSHALDWCREEKGVACGVYPTKSQKYNYVAFMSATYTIKGVNFKTHPEAASELLTAVLNYLKEQDDERNKV